MVCCQSFLRGYAVYFLTVLLGVGVALGSCPDEGCLTQLSFCTALRAIQARYPELQRRHALWEAALAGKSLASSRCYPKVTLSETFSHTNDPVGVFMAKLKQASFQSSDFEIDHLNHPSSLCNLATGVRMELSLFDAFQTIAANRIACHGIEGAEAFDRFVQQESVLVAVESYLNTVLANKVYHHTCDMLTCAERDLGEAESLMEKGLVLGADFYSARVATAKVSQNLQSAYSAKRIAESTLNILMGQCVDEPLELTGAIPAPSTLRQSLEYYLQQGLCRRGDLVATQAAMYAADRAAQAARNSALPTVTAFAQGEYNTRPFDRNGSSYAVGMMGSIDLYDPGYAARVRAADATSRLKQAETVGLRDAICRSVTDAFISYESLLSKLSAAERAAEDANRALSLMERLYREGRKSIADLTSLRLMGLDSVVSLEQLRCDIELRRVRLLFVSGQLDGCVVEHLCQGIDS